MQSTIEEVVQFYRNIVASPSLLANGYEIIKQFLFSHQKHRANTLLALLHPTVPVLQLIVNIYPNEVFNHSAINLQQKKQTIGFLLNLLTGEILKTQSLLNKNIDLLFQLLYKIHNIEGYKDCVPFYQKALEVLLQNKSKHFGYFLSHILKEADDRVHELTRFLLKLVVAQQNMLQTQQKLTILYYCFKSMAFLHETDPDTIQTYVSPYIQPSILFVRQNISGSVKAMKYSLKILTVLFADYEIQCQKQILQLIEQTTRQLISQYLIFLNRNHAIDQSNDALDEQQEDESQPIEVALYQMLELFMTLYEMKHLLNYELVVYLCIVSTFISECQYRSFINNSDQYFIQIEDEGQMTARNKAIYFLESILTGKAKNKYNANCKKMLKEYVGMILNWKNEKSSLIKYAESYNLPTGVLNLNEIYTESTLFIIYSFSDILIENQKLICKYLADIITNGHAKAIDCILAILILNPIVKKQEKKDKEQYVQFINSKLYKYVENIGMQLALVRSIYAFYPVEHLEINQKENNNIPIFFVQKLLLYTLKNDSYQNESGYLIVDFLVHLFKNEKNAIVLPAFINYNVQIELFKKYMHDGMTSNVLIKLLSHLKNEQILKQMWNGLMHGHVKDTNISTLIVNGMTAKILTFSQKDIINLFNLYEKSMEIIQDVVTIFLEHHKITDQHLITLLNHHCNSKWVHLLIKQNRLNNLQQTFLKAIQKVTYQVTSLCDFENHLLMPYLLLVKNFNQAISILRHNKLFDAFFQKLFSYAKIFKGANLKMITILIFIELATQHKALIPNVLELDEIYGSLQENEWEQQLQGENEQDMLNNILQNIENGEVEDLFEKAFGQLCFNNPQKQAKIQYLRSIK